MTSLTNHSPIFFPVLCIFMYFSLILFTHTFSCLGTCNQFKSKSAGAPVTKRAGAGGVRKASASFLQEESPPRCCSVCRARAPVASSRRPAVQHNFSPATRHSNLDHSCSEGGGEEAVGQVVVVCRGPELSWLWDRAPSPQSFVVFYGLKLPHYQS